MKKSAKLRSATDLKAVHAAKSNEKSILILQSGDGARRAAIDLPPAITQLMTARVTRKQFKPKLIPIEYDFGKVTKAEAPAICSWEYGREYARECLRRGRAVFQGLSEPPLRSDFFPNDPFYIGYAIHSPALAPTTSKQSISDLMEFLESPAPRPYQDMRPAVELRIKASEIFATIEDRSPPHFSLTRELLDPSPSSSLIMTRLDYQFTDTQIRKEFDAHLKKERERKGLPNPKREFHPIGRGALKFPAHPKRALTWLAVHRLRREGVSWSDISSPHKYGVSENSDYRELMRQDEYAKAIIDWLCYGEVSGLRKLPALRERKDQ